MSGKDLIISEEKEGVYKELGYSAEFLKEMINKLLLKKHKMMCKCLVIDYIQSADSKM